MGIEFSFGARAETCVCLQPALVILVWTQEGRFVSGLHVSIPPGIPRMHLVDDGVFICGNGL
jgi:hypothetical protein